jgi:hypothetical protein
MTKAMFDRHIAILEHEIRLYGYSIVFGLAEQYHVRL